MDLSTEEIDVPQAKSRPRSAICAADCSAVAGKVARTSLHPWAPDAQALNRIDTHHAWEKLGDALDRLDLVHGIATFLRRAGYLPVVEGRDRCEDYRWLHTDQLVGNPAKQREFWLANRSEGKPGIYTITELTEHGIAAHQTRQLGHDRFTDAHLDNGGVREGAGAAAF